VDGNWSQRNQFKTGQRKLNTRGIFKRAVDENQQTSANRHTEVNRNGKVQRIRSLDNKKLVEKSTEPRLEESEFFSRMAQTSPMQAK